LSGFKGIFLKNKKKELYPFGVSCLNSKRLMPQMISSAAPNMQACGKMEVSVYIWSVKYGISASLQTTLPCTVLRG